MEKATDRCRYCWQGKEGNKIQEADDAFMQLDFGGVPVILVFTKLDELRDITYGASFRRYKRNHPNCPSARSTGDLPEEYKREAEDQQQADFVKARDKLWNLWKTRHGSRMDLQKVFVSSEPGI